MKTTSTLNPIEKLSQLSSQRTARMHGAVCMLLGEMERAGVKPDERLSVCVDGWTLSYHYIRSKESTDAATRAATEEATFAATYAATDSVTYLRRCGEYRHCGAGGRRMLAVLAQDPIICPTCCEIVERLAENAREEGTDHV